MAPMVKRVSRLKHPRGQNPSASIVPVRPACPPSGDRRTNFGQWTRTT